MKQFKHVYIEITNMCNFNCPFCSSAKNAKQNISLKDFENVLNQVKEFTNEICLHVLGEPLLYKQFDELIEIVQKHNLKINLVTNGFFIKEKLPIIIKFASLFNKISFSLHSYSYNIIDAEKKLNEIFESSKQIAKCGINVELRNVENFNNDEFKILLKNLIVEKFNIDLLNTSGTQKFSDKLYYVPKKEFAWPDKTTDSEPTVKTNGMYCLGGRTHIAILSNLDVVPCCLDSGANLKLGNLKQQSLKEILQSEKFKNLIESFGKGIAINELCKTCKYNKNFLSSDK